MVRIARVLVSGLFGMFDHEVEMNLESRVTMITGPNGLGKTALLRLVSALFNGDCDTLCSIPFARIEVMFDDGQDLTADVSQKEIRWSRRETPFSLPGLGHCLPEDDSARLAFGEQAIFYHQPPLSELEARHAEAPAWFSGLKQELPVRFIRTDRLMSYVPARPMKSRPPRAVPAVQMCADRLEHLIRSELADHSALSQRLDRTFPTRVIDSRGRPGLSADELRNKLADLEQKYAHHAEVGLLDPGQHPLPISPGEIDDHVTKVLSVYVQDVEEKLGALDDIAARLELFLKMLNGRFRYKQVAIDREHGFTITTETGRRIMPKHLSSGEQHQVVVFHDLLFKVKPGALILIDEPELSLHVAWQDRFLEDMLTITELRKFDVLIATHSPDIIGKHWDLARELKGPAQ